MTGTLMVGTAGARRAPPQPAVAPRSLVRQGTSHEQEECPECRAHRTSLRPARLFPANQAAHQACSCSAAKPLPAASSIGGIGRDFSRTPVHTSVASDSRAMPMRGHFDPATTLRYDRKQLMPAATRAKIINGVDVTKGHCGCVKELTNEIAWSKSMAKLYGDCGKDPKLKTGTDIESCVDADLKKRGIATTVAGTTSPSGAVAVTKSPGPCGPLKERATEIHEGVHNATQKALEKKFGKGTAAFKAAWDEAKSWAMDDANAYNAEVPFYTDVIAYLKTICP